MLAGGLGAPGVEPDGRVRVGHQCCIGDDPVDPAVEADHERRQRRLRLHDLLRVRPRPHPRRARNAPRYVLNRRDCVASEHSRAAMPAPALAGAAAPSLPGPTHWTASRSSEPSPLTPPGSPIVRDLQAAERLARVPSVNDIGWRQHAKARQNRHASATCGLGPPTCATAPGAQPASGSTRRARNWSRQPDDRRPAAPTRARRRRPVSSRLTYSDSHSRVGAITSRAEGLGFQSDRPVTGQVADGADPDTSGRSGACLCPRRRLYTQRRRPETSVRHTLQAGGHRFDPDTLHLLKTPLRRRFFVRERDTTMQYGV